MYWPWYNDKVLISDNRDDKQFFLDKHENFPPLNLATFPSAERGMYVADQKEEQMGVIMTASVCITSIALIIYN